MRNDEKAAGGAQSRIGVQQSDKFRIGKGFGDDRDDRESQKAIIGELAAATALADHGRWLIMYKNLLQQKQKLVSQNRFHHPKEAESQTVLPPLTKP